MPARGGAVPEGDRRHPQPVRHRPHRAADPPALHARLRRGTALRSRGAGAHLRAGAALPGGVPAVAQVEPRPPGAAVRAARERPPAEPHRGRHQHELLPGGAAGAPQRRLLHPPHVQGQPGLQVRAAELHRLPDREALLARVVHRGRPLALRQAAAAALRAARQRGRRVPARQERGRHPDPGGDRVRPDPGRRLVHRRAARRGEAEGELRLVRERDPRAADALRRHLHPLRQADLPRPAARAARPARRRARIARRHRGAAPLDPEARLRGGACASTA